MRIISFLFLLFLTSLPLTAQNLEGTYELVLENHSKQTITIRKVNDYEEVEYRWYDGKWILKCTYHGAWSVVGDTLILKPITVVWRDKQITTCRDQDDPQQPGCCFTTAYFYDDKNIWNFGPISKTKFLFGKVKTEGR